MILIERLKTASEQHKGTDIGELLAQAASHISEQNNGIRIANALHTAAHLMRTAMGTIDGALKEAGSKYDLPRQPMAPFTEAGRRKVEAAAKAAGYQWRGFSAAGEPMLNEDVSKPLPRFVVPTFWNPRDNDGDSRRLASDMDMTVTVRPHEVEVFHDELDYPVSMAFGPDDDRHSIVRLAVLEAAAWVGDAV